MSTPGTRCFRVLTASRLRLAFLPTSYSRLRTGPELSKLSRSRDPVAERGAMRQLSPDPQKCSHPEVENSLRERLSCDEAPEVLHKPIHSRTIAPWRR